MLHVAHFGFFNLALRDWWCAGRMVLTSFTGDLWWNLSSRLTGENFEIDLRPLHDVEHHHRPWNSELICIWGLIIETASELRSTGKNWLEIPLQWEISYSKLRSNVMGAQPSVVLYPSIVVPLICALSYADHMVRSAATAGCPGMIWKPFKRLENSIENLFNLEEEPTKFIWLDKHWYEQILLLDPPRSSCLFEAFDDKRTSAYSRCPWCPWPQFSCIGMAELVMHACTTWRWLHDLYRSDATLGIGCNCGGCWCTGGCMHCCGCNTCVGGRGCLWRAKWDLGQEHGNYVEYPTSMGIWRKNNMTIIHGICCGQTLVDGILCG